MKILFHICCAPCTIYPLEVLSQKFEKVIGLFYNPNIHPYLEYVRRLKAVKQYAEITNLKIIYKEDYPLEDYLRQIVYRENKRCCVCYAIRLEYTASLARHGKFNAFTTSLLYSKHQNHDLIVDICENLAAKYGVDFFYADFRQGWKQGIEKSKSMGMYRQQYCGCIYSERDRFQNQNQRSEQTCKDNILETNNEN